MPYATREHLTRIRAGDPGKRIQGWLTTQLWKAVVVEAKRDGLSLSGFVFEALNNEVQRRRANRPPYEAPCGPEHFW